MSPILDDDTGRRTSAMTVIDAEEKRSYRVLDSLIVEVDSKFWHPGWYKHVLAADGGLIYTMYSDPVTQLQAGGRSTQVHIVCDPVSRSYHQIRQPEVYFSYQRDIVVMSVDNETKTYKIITVPSFEAGRRGEVHLYDSTTERWRKLCEVPGDASHAYHTFSCIIMNGILYTLFMEVPTRSQTCLHPMLYTCDFETGAWTKVDVELPPLSHRQKKSLLVRCMNRLFMVEYTGVERRGGRARKLVTLEIWEIVLAEEKEVVDVAITPNRSKFSSYSSKMLRDYRDELMGEPVVAVGLADSIVVSCVMGQRVKYDFLQERWFKLPEFASYDAHEVHCQGICAGLVDF